MRVKKKSKYPMSGFSWECLLNKSNSNCRFVSNVIRISSFCLLYFECEKSIFIVVISKRNHDELEFTLLIP